ncbi:hypothetical protein NL676_025393 [Syzygium grande]|nr:hypothetical protein NL676_025393 [Syzygium grande]
MLGSQDNSDPPGVSRARSSRASADIGGWGLAAMASSASPRSVSGRKPYFSIKRSGLAGVSQSSPTLPWRGYALAVVRRAATAWWGGGLTPDARGGLALRPTSADPAMAMEGREEKRMWPAE